ncbi:glycosyltransferase, partial [Campylobacter sp. RM12654]|nr:glycosyltransferase [Campylobacter sp. RM12654]
MPLISIILPTYNVEKYITRALESCINQTLKDIEIIVVDDKGQDKSIDIAYEYANKDSRIKIIHNKENLKLLHARAEGVKVATSELIMFLDPDDELELDACEIAYNNFDKNYNVLRFGYNLIDFPKTQPQSLNIAKSYDEVIEGIKQLEFFDFTMWGMLLQKKLYLQAYQFIQYHSVKKINFNEDVIFNYVLISIINNFKYIPNKLYNYYYNPTSLTKVDNIEKFKLEIELFKKTIIFFETLQEQFPNVFNKEITNSYIYHFYLFIYIREKKILKQTNNKIMYFFKNQLLKSRLKKQFLTFIKNKKILYRYYKNKFFQTNNKKYLKKMKKLGLLYLFKSFVLEIKTKKIKKQLIEFIEFYFYKKRKILKIIQNNYHSLVVIPSESLKTIENAGMTNIEQYYNPNKVFKNVFLLSPNEKGFKYKHGMYIFGVSKYTYKLMLKIIKPKLVRAYGGYWASTFAVKNKVDNIPVVCSIHDKRDSFIYDEVVNSDYVFYTSYAVKDILIAKGVNENKMHYLPDRVKLTDFYKVKELDGKPLVFQDGFKYILTVARMSDEKNLETIIKALKHLPSNYRWIHIGRGDLNYYLKLSQELDVLDKVIHIDSVKNNELKYYYSFADCFCLLSKSEGFGIVYIEAAACECSIIASNISPINVNFKHNENIILLDNYFDDIKTAEIIKQVCEEPNSILISNAKNNIKQFSADIVDEMESNYYKQIIQGKL